MQEIRMFDLDLFILISFNISHTANKANAIGNISKDDLMAMSHDLSDVILTSEILKHQ